ncbi:hypothetical protein SVIO_101560 [Streptomyces violaceusniger]|uniref:Uncharacterized protein n=1 Tax=Streptomyces violaceusniger TaxID=68280 RepID=A0A4D4LN89_STRVO|nr:hypothetical protein SVIO_101560 [Streptomyces violaceusniger]
MMAGPYAPDLTPREQAAHGRPIRLSHPAQWQGLDHPDGLGRGGAPEPLPDRALQRAQGRCPPRPRFARSDGGHDDLTPLRVVHPHHACVPDTGLFPQDLLHHGRGHLHTAGDDHVIRPAEYLKTAVLPPAPEVVRAEPAVAEGTGRQLRPVEVAGRQGRSAESYRTARAGPGRPFRWRTDPHPYPLQRHPVVDAAAGGLGHAVRGHHPHTRLARPRQQWLGCARAAQQYGVELP